MAHLCDVYVFVIHPGPVACYLVSTTNRHFLGIPWKIMWRFSGMGHVGPCSSHDTGSCPHSSWCDGTLYKVFDFGSADSTGASFASRAEVLSANTVFDKLKELGHKCHKSIEFAMPLPCLCHAFAMPLPCLSWHLITTATSISMARLGRDDPLLLPRSEIDAAHGRLSRARREINSMIFIKDPD